MAWFYSGNFGLRFLGLDDYRRICFSPLIFLGGDALSYGPLYFRIMKLIQAIAIILFPPLVFLLVTLFFGFSLDFYQNEYGRISSLQTIGKAEALANAKDVYGYLNGKKDRLAFAYTGKEKLHLADIKNIIFGVKLFTLILFISASLIFFLICFKKGIRILIKTIFWANIFSLLAYLGFIAILTFYFDQLFLLFHQIFFRNNFWLLDPAKEVLINFFPPEFFANLLGKIIKTTIFINVIFIILSLIFSRINEKRQRLSLI